MVVLDLGPLPEASGVLTMLLSSLLIPDALVRIPHKSSRTFLSILAVPFISGPDSSIGLGLVYLRLLLLISQYCYTGESLDRFSKDNATLELCAQD